MNSFSIIDLKVHVACTNIAQINHLVAGRYHICLCSMLGTGNLYYLDVRLAACQPTKNTLLYVSEICFDHFGMLIDLYFCNNFVSEIKI